MALHAAIQLKICGMRDVENIQEVTALSPQYMGFIFYRKSPRFVGDDFVMPALAPGIKKVGVFVNETTEAMLQAASRYDLTLIQLHGDETPEQCRALKATGLGVVKVFSVGEDFDWSTVQPYKSVADFFLFDTKGKYYGGNAQAFDWSLLQQYDQEIPFFLSGGLSAENIDAVARLKGMNLYALDVNSGVEDSPGVKSISKIESVLEKLKALNRSKPESMKYTVNEKGYYGKFGGAYIPEMLYPNVEELRTRYLDIIYEEGFQKEFQKLLRDYVGRPTPLYLANRLSEKYGATIYLKREDLCHTGAHKVNNTIGQILLAKRLGKQKIIAETGAGQHGVATATVCALMGMECIVYMGKIDMERQRPNVERMRILGATVVPALSGSMTLKDATNEAMRHWINNPTDTHYIIGSVVGPHPYPDMVARFQSVISEEMKKQLQEEIGNPYPDYVFACVGGGSNAAGAFYHFLDDEHVTLVASEAAGKGVDSGESAATTALGKPGVLHGSKTILMQTEDGQVVEPYSISAGLDYPGIGPIHAHLFDVGRVKFVSATDDEAMNAGLELSRMEGIIPAIESAHALAALSQFTFEKDDVVVVNLSGRGDKDLETYIRWGKY